METKKTGNEKKPTRPPVVYRDNAHRFQVLAKKRVNKTLKQISLIGNLSGAGYDYTPLQVEKIKDALTTGLVKALVRFDNAKSEDTFEI